MCRRYAALAVWTTLIVATSCKRPTREPEARPTVAPVVSVQGERDLEQGEHVRQNAADGYLARFNEDRTRFLLLAETASVWDVATGLSLLRLHLGPVPNATFTTQGDIAVGGRRASGGVAIYDRDTGQKLRTFSEDEGQSILCVEFGPADTAVVVDDERRIWIWNTLSGKKLPTTAQAMRDPRCRFGEAQFNKAGSRLLMRVADNATMLLDTTTGKTLATLPDPFAQLDNEAGVVAHRDEKPLAIILTELDTGTTLRRIAAPKPLRAIAFAANGTTLVAAGWDSKTYLFSSESGDLLASLESKGSRISGGVWLSKDRTRLVTNGRYMKLWDVSTTALLLEFDTYTHDDISAPSVDFAVLEDADLLVLGDKTGQLRGWSLETGAAVVSHPVFDGPATSLRTDPESKRVVLLGHKGFASWHPAAPDAPVSRAFSQAPSARVAAFDDGLHAIEMGERTSVWNLVNDEELAALHSVESLRPLLFDGSPHGPVVAVASTGSIAAWNLHDGTLTQVDSGSFDPMAVSTTRDGDWLAFSDRGGVAIWSPNNGDGLRVHKFQGSPAALHSVDPQGRVAAVATDKRGFVFGPEADDERVLDLKGIQTLTYSVDGSNLLIESDDSVVWVQDASSGHSERVTEASVSEFVLDPAGKYVFLRGSPNLLVDLQKGWSEVSEIEDHVARAAFDAEGSGLVVLRHDARLEFFDLTGTPRGLHSTPKRVLRRYDEQHALSLSPGGSHALLRSHLDRGGYAFCLVHVDRGVVTDALVLPDGTRRARFVAPPAAGREGSLFVLAEADTVHLLRLDGQGNFEASLELDALRTPDGVVPFMIDHDGRHAGPRAALERVYFRTGSKLDELSSAVQLARASKTATLLERFWRGGSKPPTSDAPEW